MNYDDALVILGLTPDTCTLDHLKKAYAKAAKAHRPEIDPEGFTRVRLAYERVQEALAEAETANIIDQSATTDTDNQSVYSSLSPLGQTIVKQERLNLNHLSEDFIVRQHQTDVLALDAAWKIFLNQFLATEFVSETEREAAQVACLHAIFKEPALSHYLSRQIFAETLGWLLLEEADAWISLEALKLVLKTFDYESYGWHNQSWTQHSLLEAKCDGLREKKIFQLNAKQKDSLEYRLTTPMGVFSFAKLWFIHRRQAKALKLRLAGIQQKYPQWVDELLDKKQIWRIENWPSTLVQLFCLLLGLVSTPLLFLVINYVNYHFFQPLFTQQPVTIASNGKEAMTTLKIIRDISTVIGATVCGSLVYMSIYAQCRYYINLHYKNFTKDIHLDTDEQTDATLRLNVAQRVYKRLRRTVTLSFFGNIEAVLVLILLFFWPWQRPQIFSLETMNLYVIASAAVAVWTFIYLRYLSKRQRIRPNHPYICAGAVFLGVYMFSNTSTQTSASVTATALTQTDNPARWTVLILMALMVRTQFPSFLRIDWSQPIPSWLVFNQFRVLEKVAVTTLSAVSIALFLIVVFLNDIFAHPTIASLICLVIYLWLIVNADMDAPVMSMRARVITTIAVIAGISIKLSPAMSKVAALEWILSSGMLVSMTWYWIYGYFQNYFERWTVKPISK